MPGSRRCLARSKSHSASIINGTGARRPKSRSRSTTRHNGALHKRRKRQETDRAAQPRRRPTQRDLQRAWNRLCMRHLGHSQHCCRCRVDWTPRLSCCVLSAGACEWPAGAASQNGPKTLCTNAWSCAAGGATKRCETRHLQLSPRLHGQYVVGVHAVVVQRLAAVVKLDTAARCV